MPFFFVIYAETLEALLETEIKLSLGRLFLATYTIFFFREAREISLNVAYL